MWIPCVVLAAAAVSIAVWQDRGAPPESQLFRVTAARVQLDALFLDSQNRPVVDIGPHEVTVKQAGVIVPVADFRFRSRRVPALAPVSTGGPPESPRASRASGTATVAAEDDEPWVFLIDDLAISPDGFDRAKNGILAILERDMLAGAVVGILRTGVLGRHQTRLSNDRVELLRAVEGMRYTSNRWQGGIMSRSGATVGGPANSDRVFIEGTLGSLNSLLLSLRPLPGRKVVVVLSEMIALTADESDVLSGGALRTVRWDPKYTGVWGRLMRLGRLAAETGVTVHVVDLAGVTAASAINRAQLVEGLRAVADELGGLHVGSSNEIGPLLEEVIAAEQGHYVLAYEPPAGTFDDGGKSKFIEVSVAVSRPGVRVRTRKGFFTR